MKFGELGRWHSPDGPVGPDFVVVLTPVGDCRLGLVQRFEPLLVQAFIAEPSVEAFDVAVLQWPAGFDQDVPNPMGVRRLHLCLLRGPRVARGYN